MKVVSSIGALKNRSKDCQIVKRRGRVYVICKSDPRLKVRQGRAKMKRKKSILFVYWYLKLFLYSYSCSVPIIIFS